METIASRILAVTTDITAQPRQSISYPNNTDKCPACGGLGVLGWKTPRHYPIAEVDFCDCERGAAVLEHERRAEAAKRQRLLDNMFAAAGIPAHFRGMTIESLYQAAADDPAKREGMTAARELIETGFTGGKKGLYIHGKYGVGKTGVVTPILRNYLDNGLTGLWIEFYDFTDEVQSRYRSNAEETAQAAVKQAQEVDMLLLDDVGNPRGATETDDRSKILYQVVNARHNHARPMLITSNLAPGEFVKQLGARTWERIAESCRVVEMAGRNLRK
jgi:DNA replication protein DnaC